MIPAMRKRGRARRASNVRAGSKKIPLRVSAVDIVSVAAAGVGGSGDGATALLTGGIGVFMSLIFLS
jgi:hypothetical protein